MQTRCKKNLTEDLPLESLHLDSPLPSGLPRSSLSSTDGPVDGVFVPTTESKARNVEPPSFGLFRSKVTTVIGKVRSVGDFK